MEFINALRPTRIADAEGVLRDARRRAEATIEIDTAAQGRVCPRCGAAQKVRGGRTRAGAQRWRCQNSGRTWSGLTGTLVVGAHRTDLVVEVLRDMMTNSARARVASMHGRLASRTTRFGAGACACWSVWLRLPTPC